MDREDGACDINWTAKAVTVSLMCDVGLPNFCSVNGVGISLLGSRLNLRLGTRDKYKVTIGTCNVWTLIGRSRDLVEVLQRKQISVYCVQETKLNVYWIMDILNSFSPTKLSDRFQINAKYFENLFLKFVCHMKSCKFNF